jgi:predicted AAA+ superfamily ATPase
MKRTIDKALIEWKNRDERLVLLLRGARQVGKTYSVRALGAEFPHFLEINFEEQRRAGAFFEGDLDADRLCEKLSAYARVPIAPGKTLLFFDEVQASPGCLRALRFFHEKMPALHVVAAGSLLEFALSEIPSFGVGRIASLFMYPLSFMEFLRADGDEALADYVEGGGASRPLDVPLHEKVLDRLRGFLLIGGMPAVVDAYRKRHDLLECRQIIESLVTSIVDDLAKYDKRIPARILRDALRSVSRQAGGKFQYAAVGEGLTARETKSALDALERAHLIHRIPHTAARGIPLGAERNDRRFKVIPFDVGFHQRLLGLDVAEHLVARPGDMVNKGSLAEVFAGLEIIACGYPYRSPELYYWHRERPDSNAEVDYVVQNSDRIVPVEVKSGTRGSMQSLRIFLKERGFSLGFRLSQENVGNYDNIRVLPLYMAGMLSRAVVGV